MTHHRQKNSFEIGQLHIKNRLQPKLRLVVSQTFGKVASQLRHGAPHFLDDIGVNLVDVGAALVLHHFQKADGQGVFVDAPASVQSSYDDFGIGDGVVTGEVVHGLTHVPPVRVFTIEEALVPGKGG